MAKSWTDEKWLGSGQPEEFTKLVFALEVLDNDVNSSVRFISIQVGEQSIYDIQFTTEPGLSEDNEWLKLLENDYKIKSFYVKKINSELNTAQDLKYLSKIYK